MLDIVVFVRKPILFVACSIGVRSDFERFPLVDRECSGLDVRGPEHITFAAWFHLVSTKEYQGQVPDPY